MWPILRSYKSIAVFTPNALCWSKRIKICSFSPLARQAELLKMLWIIHKEQVNWLTARAHCPHQWWAQFREYLQRYMVSVSWLYLMPLFLHCLAPERQRSWTLTRVSSRSLLHDCSLALQFQHIQHPKTPIVSKDTAAVWLFCDRQQIDKPKENYDGQDTARKLHKWAKELRRQSTGFALCCFSSFLLPSISLHFASFLLG